MITRQKIEIYKKYGGDFDGLLRCATEIEQKLFNENDWSIIVSAIQDIELIEKGLCSLDYKTQVQKKLITYFDRAALEILEKDIK